LLDALNLYKAENEGKDFNMMLCFQKLEVARSGIELDSHSMIARPVKKGQSSGAGWNSF
jgi:hypothetical protein